METRNTDKLNEPLISPPLEKRLMAISDITLGVIIAVFFPYCDPPQRKYLIDKGEKPVWWPESEPYKEPNNLKKKAKVNVLAAIIENLSPNFSKMEKVVMKSKSLEKTMSNLESYIWSSILTYLKEYHNKSYVVPVPVPNSAVPFVDNITNNQETDGPNEFVGRNPNEGGSNGMGLPKANLLPENPSLPNERIEEPLDLSNDIFVQHESYDQEFWQFMNNNQK